MGWAIRGALGGLHGGHRCDATQPGDPRVLRALAQSRQAQEGGHRCLHAQTAHHPQCHAARSSALERNSAPKADRIILTSKTVANPLQGLPSELASVSLTLSPNDGSVQWEPQ